MTLRYDAQKKQDAVTKLAGCVSMANGPRALGVVGLIGSLVHTPTCGSVRSQCRHVEHRIGVLRECEFNDAIQNSARCETSANGISGVLHGCGSKGPRWDAYVALWAGRILAREV